MEIDCVMVWTTIGSSTDGRKLASVLVEERLAACVNVMGEMDIGLQVARAGGNRARASGRHEDDGGSHSGAEGTPPRTSRLRAPRIHRRSYHRAAASRTCSGSESRRPGDIIRRIPALWIAAIVLKVLVWLTAPDNVALDRTVNFALIALAAVSVYRLTTLARSGILWRVSGKLILSYILVGAVPILLLVTFSLLAFLLIFFDISAYLVQSRVTALTDQATTLARTTLFEVERAPGNLQEIVSRRESAIATRFPGVSVEVLSAEEIPPWLKQQAFAGLVLTEHRMIVRAVGFPRDRPPAVCRRSSIFRSTGCLTPRRWLRPASASASGGGRSVFNTATFLTHTNWQTGETARTAMPMSVDVPALYRFLGRSKEAGNALSFNQLASLRAGRHRRAASRHRGRGAWKRPCAGAIDHVVGGRAVPRDRARQERRVRPSNRGAPDPRPAERDAARRRRGDPARHRPRPDARSPASSCPRRPTPRSTAATSSSCRPGRRTRPSCCCGRPTTSTPTVSPTARTRSGGTTCSTTARRSSPWRRSRTRPSSRRRSGSTTSTSERPTTTGRPATSR